MEGNVGLQFEVGDSSLLGPELIFKTLEKVHIIRKQFK